MTVERLYEMLATLIKEGCAKAIIKAWDPNADDFEPITNLTYTAKSEEPVCVFTDEL